MKHIEDLAIETFIDLINNMDKWNATIKIDGTCAINFGFDDNGRLYTAFGRDFKNILDEQKKYSPSDWMKRNIIMNNPGVFAHAVLDSCAHLLRPKLPNNTPVVAEIVLKDQPNCIQYKIDKNLLIILNYPGLLNSEKGSVSIPQIIINDWDVINIKKQFDFLITTPHQINTDIFQINREVQKLNSYANNSTNGIANIDIYKSRIPSEIKDIIRCNIDGMKLDIKDKLIKALSNIEGGIPLESGYGHEGFVIHYQDQYVKVVNKHQFTQLHNTNWAPAHDAKRIRLGIIKKEIGQGLGLNQLKKMVVDFDELYPFVSKDMKNHMINQIKMAYIDIRRSK